MDASGRTFSGDLLGGTPAERYIPAALAFPASSPVPFGETGGAGSIVYRKFGETLLLAFIHPSRHEAYASYTGNLTGRKLSEALRICLNGSVEEGRRFSPSDFTSNKKMLDEDRSNRSLYDSETQSEVMFGDVSVGPKFEMKSDDACWMPRRKPYGTGNAFIEFAQWGMKRGYPDVAKTKPSGLAITESDTFAISLGDWEAGQTVFVLLTPTDVLRKMVLPGGSPDPKLYVVEGGSSDYAAKDNPTRGVVFPIANLLTP